MRIFLKGYDLILRRFCGSLLTLCGIIFLLLLQVAAAATHTVKKGETLYSLSRSYGVSVNEITAANPGIDSHSLKPGDLIQIPGTGENSSAVKPDKEGSQESPGGPELCVVKKGDTLSSISRQSGVSSEEIMRLNGLRGGQIRVGQKLQLKRGSTPRAVPVARIERGPAPKPPKTAPRYLFVSKAKDKIDEPRIGSRIWRYIVVHHSGTPNGSARIFEYYHRNVRGMENGMAYHFVIGNGTDTGDGEIEVGNRWLKQLQGGHLRSEEQDEVAIGICLVGDFNTTRPTRKQMAALIELITYLQDRVQNVEHIKPRFVVHRDINIRPTACPGKYFPAEAMYKLFGPWTGE